MIPKRLVILALAMVAAMPVRAQLLINGAGSSFAAPLYQGWFNAYRKIDPSVAFNYQAIGSGGGQKQILAETVDFGASDGPMSDENLAKAPRPLWHIPTAAGAVVLSYNLPGNVKLHLDGATLGDIFLGKITNWSDPAIAGQNPAVALPNKDIVVVHRSDSSGTSYIFTDYLSAVSPAWKAKVGKGVAVQWPAGLGGKGNAGVTGQIKQTPGSIGYVELAYAHTNHLSYAAIRNSSGAYIEPTTSAVTDALATATIPDDFRFSMVNSPSPTGYPIAGVTWMLVYSEQKDAVKGAKLVAFLKWAFAEGEKMAPDNDYAPLPDALVGRILDRVSKIKY